MEITCFTWNVNVSLWNMTIACALQWRVAYVGRFSIGMAHPIRENISGVEQTPVNGAHLRPQL